MYYFEKMHRRGYLTWMHFSRPLKLIKEVVFIAIILAVLQPTRPSLTGCELTAWTKLYRTCSGSNGFTPVRLCVKRNSKRNAKRRSITKRKVQTGGRCLFFPGIRKARSNVRELFLNCYKTHKKTTTPFYHISSWMQTCSCEKLHSLNIVFTVWQLLNTHVNRKTVFPKRLRVRPANTRISLCIRAVWSESTQGTLWVAKYLRRISDGQEMRRLIWVFAGCTYKYCRKW